MNLHRVGSGLNVTFAGFNHGNGRLTDFGDLDGCGRGDGYNIGNGRGNGPEEQSDFLLDIEEEYPFYLIIY